LKSAWSRSQLEIAYRRTELKDFLHDNPVLRIMQLELIGSLTGPVQAASSTTNKLDAAMNLWKSALA
jgi:hypothetical protein